MVTNDEFVNIGINKEIYEILKLWNKERKEDIKNHKNAMTRQPIYKVQKNVWGVGDYENFDKEEIMVDCETFLTLEQIKDGDLDYYIDHHCPDKDNLETIKNYIKKRGSLEEVLEVLQDNEINIYRDEIVYSKEEWEDKAYFLTHQEAKDYMQYQKHNLGQCIIYVDAPGYGNRGTFDTFLQLLDHKDIFEVE